jgi:hypothetical protein
VIEDPEEAPATATDEVPNATAEEEAKEHLESSIEDVQEGHEEAGEAGIGEGNLKDELAMLENDENGDHQEESHDQHHEGSQNEEAHENGFNQGSFLEDQMDEVQNVQHEEE